MAYYNQGNRYAYMEEAREARLTMWAESKAKMINMAKEAIENEEYQKAIAYLYDAKRAQAYIKAIERHKK